jgi:hypothetical protein
MNNFPSIILPFKTQNNRDLILYQVVMSNEKWKMGQSFVAFSEYLNFNVLTYYQISMFILINHKMLKIRMLLDNNFGHIVKSNDSVVGRLSDHFIIPIFLELLKYYFLFHVEKRIHLL